jgi:hypothetical protein
LARDGLSSAGDVAGDVAGVVAVEGTDGEGRAGAAPSEEAARGPPDTPHPDIVRTATMVTGRASSRERHR